MNRSVTKFVRVRSVWTDILMAGMLIVCLFGMTVSSGYSQEATPAKTGKVTGRLFDAETGEALLGATV